MSETINLNNTLEERVNELEQKANRVEQSKNTEQKIKQATVGIKRISTRLDTVQQKTDELRFFVHFFEEGFDESRPGSVQPKLRTAMNKIEISDDELLAAAQEDRLTDLEDQVEEAEELVDGAIDMVKINIRTEQEKWLSDLDSAMELNRIIGGDSEFQDLIRRMRKFLTQKIWDTSKSPSRLANQWNRYEQKWKDNTGRHGWETFQREHGLDDDTVEELQQFSDDDPVRLSDLSIETLKDIKRVSELESALQIEVRS